MSIKSIIAGSALLLCIGSVVPLATSPAEAQTRTYALLGSASCGKIKAGRSLSQTTYGTLVANAGIIDWTFHISDSTSTIEYDVCGAAAPYGSYPTAASAISQRFALTVTGSRVSGCQAGSGGSCSVGATSATLAYSRSYGRSSGGSIYVNGTSVTAYPPTRVTVRSSGSVVDGSASGSVADEAKTWAF
jgi:hypothetical protein